MSMAIVGIAGVAVGAAGTMYSANAAKQAGKAANKSNERLQREENQRKQDNYDAGLKRIWGDQQSTVRDEILGSRTGLADAYSGYGDSINSLIDSYRPSLQGSAQTTNDLFSGNTLSGRLANLQGVLDARTGAVKSQQDSYLNAYQQLQAQRKATQMRQGYFGGGSYADRLGRADLIGLNTNNANAASLARLQNAQDVFGIQENDNTNRLNSVMLPYNMATSGAGLNNLRTQAYVTERTAPMATMLNQLGQFSNMTPFSPDTASVPTAQVVPTNGVGTALSQVGSTVAAYGMNQYQQQQQAARDKALMDQLGLLSSGGNGTWQATNTYQGYGAPASTATYATADATGL